jgi:hypothetical protein
MASMAAGVSPSYTGPPHGKGRGTFFWEPTKGGPGGARVFGRDGKTKPEIGACPEMARAYAAEKR